LRSAHLGKQVPWLQAGRAGIGAVVVASFAVSIAGPTRTSGDAKPRPTSPASALAQWQALIARLPLTYGQVQAGVLYHPLGSVAATAHLTPTGWGCAPLWAAVTSLQNKETSSTVFNLGATLSGGCANGTDSAQSFSGVTFQYRTSQTGAFTDIPESAVTYDGSPIAWPIADFLDGPGESSPDLSWNAAQTLASNGVLQIQALFTDASGNTYPTAPVTVTLDGTRPSQQAGGTTSGTVTTIPSSTPSSGALSGGAAIQLPSGFSLPAGTSSAVRTAIAYAVAQLGKPYIWGGTGPAGFDCSGLVMMAYQAAGIDLPRTTFEQVFSGTAVSSLSQLEPGDLLFTAGSDGTNTDPGHVGMYIGSGLVIQAAETGEPIMVTPLAGYWQDNTLAIRRIVAR
jgi:cell wall-associated NlpC family hydrolase